MSRISVLLVIFILSLSPGSGKAEDGPVLRAGIFDFFPWAIPTQGMFSDGITVDLVEALSRLAGMGIEPVFLPIARAFREVEEGRVDLVLAYKLEDMVPGVTFLDPVLGCATANIVTRRGAGIETVEDLAGKRIGFANGGYFYGEYSGKLGVEEFPLSDNRQMMTMLLRGRIDGFVINNIIFDAFMNVGPPFESDLPEGWRSQIGTTVELESLPVAVGISTRTATPALIQALQQALEKGQRDGSFNQVFRRWGSKTDWAC